MFRILPLVLAAAAAAAPCALAQANWTQLTPAIAPSARAGAVGVSDGSNVFLFGGKPTTTTEADDLWRFDGATWTNITPASGPLPPARDWYGCAYDTVRGRLVLFGGRSSALAADLGGIRERRLLIAEGPMALAFAVLSP